MVSKKKIFLFFNRFYDLKDVNKLIFIKNSQPILTLDQYFKRHWFFLHLYIGLYKFEDVLTLV